MSEVMNFQKDGRQLKGPREYVKQNLSKKENKTKAQRLQQWISKCETALFIRHGNNLNGVTDLVSKLEEIMEEAPLTPAIQQGLIYIRRNEDLEKNDIKAALHRLKAWPSMPTDEELDADVQFDIRNPQLFACSAGFEVKLKMMSECYFETLLCCLLADGADKEPEVRIWCQIALQELAEDDVFGLDDRAAKPRQEMEQTIVAVNAVCKNQFEQADRDAVDLLHKHRKMSDGSPRTIVALSFFSSPWWTQKLEQWKKVKAVFDELGDDLRESFSSLKEIGSATCEFGTEECSTALIQIAGVYRKAVATIAPTMEPLKTQGTTLLQKVLQHIEKAATLLNDQPQSAVDAVEELLEDSQLAFPAATQLQQLQIRFTEAQKGVRQSVVQEKIMGAMTEFLGTKSAETAAIEGNIVKLELQLSKSKLGDMTDDNAKTNFKECAAVIVDQITSLVKGGSLSDLLNNAIDGIRIFEDGKLDIFQLVHDCSVCTSRLAQTLKECKDVAADMTSPAVQKRATLLAQQLVAFDAVVTVVSKKAFNKDCAFETEIGAFILACQDVVIAAKEKKDELDNKRLDASSQHLNAMLAVLNDIQGGSTTCQKRWFDELPLSSAGSDAIAHAKVKKFIGTTKEWKEKLQNLGSARQEDEQLRKSLAMVEMPQNHDDAKSTHQRATITHVEDELMQLAETETLGGNKKQKVGELVQMIRKLKLKEKDALHASIYRLACEMFQKQPADKKAA